MRKLAHIEKVTNIRPIEGADSIEQVNILGWNVVIKKDEFKEGDLCVYIEIDSICPETEYFEFLRSRKFKVKTIKLRGVVSQGLIVPLSVLPKGRHDEGDDVTDILGITKHDDSEILECKVKSSQKKHVKKKLSFPSWVKKTDETRIQNMPQVLEDKSEFIVTEKVDGCSATFTLRKKLFGYEYIVCSRNRVADEGSAYTQISEKYNIKKVLKSIYKILRRRTKIKSVTIQGEIVGPKIQGNKYHLKEYDLFVFNFLVDDVLIPSEDSKKIMSLYNIKFVPIIGYIILPDTVDELVKFADGKSQLYDTPREGLVIRNDKKSFKVISIDFLLKHKI